MSGLKRFLFQEQETLKEIKYQATKKFVDEKGKPLEWVLKTLSKEEIENIYEESTKKIVVEGEEGEIGYIFDTNTYMLKLISKSVVFPNLKDLELQRSYGVSNEETLLKKLVDSPAEYRKFCEFVEELNEDNTSFEDEIAEVKELINSDVDASYAHYCLHKFNMLPSEYLKLPRSERQFIIASIQRKLEVEKEEYDKMK